MEAGWGGVAFLIFGELLAETKVDIFQRFYLGVSGTHFRKDLLD